MHKKICQKIRLPLFPSATGKNVIGKLGKTVLEKIFTVKN